MQARPAFRVPSRRALALASHGGKAATGRCGHGRFQGPRAGRASRPCDFKLRPRSGQVDQVCYSARVQDHERHKAAYAASEAPSLEI